MGCLQDSYSAVLGMMMRSEWKTLSMVAMQDDTCSMIGDFTEMTVLHYLDDLHLIQVTCAELDGQMADISEVEIEGWCHFASSFFLFCFLLLTLLLVSFSAQYKWHLHGVLPPPEISQVEVEYLGVPDSPFGYHMVLVSCGTYGFIQFLT